MPVSRGGNEVFLLTPGTPNTEVISQEETEETESEGSAAPRSAGCLNPQQPGLPDERTKFHGLGELSNVLRLGTNRAPPSPMRPAPRVDSRLNVTGGWSR